MKVKPSDGPGRKPTPWYARSVHTMRCLTVFVSLLSMAAGSLGCSKTSEQGVPPAASSVAPPIAASVPAVTGSAKVGWGEPGAAFQKGAPFSILMHADTPLRLLKGKSFDKESDVHMSLDRVRKGQLSAFAAVLFVDSKYHEEGAPYYCQRATKKIDSELSEHADVLRAGLEAKDFEKNWKSGHLTWFRTLEGSWCLQGKVASIDSYYATGIRMIGLTWQDDHDFATSWTYYGHVGLTAIGRQAVQRMNQLGIIVDVSHMSDRAVEDVLSVAKAPVFASHSNARAVCDHPRNLKDDQIRKIAATGGIVGINFYTLHLRKKGKATVADVVQHIKHIRDVGGIDCIGLGSDFDGINKGPEGLETSAELPNLRKALEDEGFTASEIAAIFGGNFLRAFADVERRARELGGS